MRNNIIDENLKKKYGEVYRRLCTETAVLLFVKNNNTPRIMLGTRNIRTIIRETKNESLVSMLGAYDKKSSIDNGVIALVDLDITEVRSFRIERLGHIEWLGEIIDNNDTEEAFKKYRYFQTINKVSLSPHFLLKQTESGLKIEDIL